MAEIKHELTFGIDNFGKQNMLSKSESVAQVLINLLFMRPGQMPSLPHLGINIKQYLYKFEEDIDVTVIRNHISSQCSALLPYLKLSSMQVILVPDESQTILFIYIPLSSLLNDETMILGIKRDHSTSEVTFNYKIQAAINN